MGLLSKFSGLYNIHGKQRNKPTDDSGDVSDLSSHQLVTTGTKFPWKHIY